MRPCVFGRILVAFEVGNALSHQSSVDCLFCGRIDDSEVERSEVE